MFECTVTDDSRFKWLNLVGRIDSMSVSEIQQQIHELTLAGERIIIANFQKVNYISSAGLRVFLTAQKQLKKAGGEIILYKMSSNVFDIFKLSGFDKIIRIVSSMEEIDAAGLAEKDSYIVTLEKINGIEIQYVKKEAESGLLTIVGSKNKLRGAAYTEEDVVKVKPADLQFGTGLATLGNKYEDYKNFFGESLIIDRNFFYYPAVKRPAVDFMLNTQQDPSLEFNFFHGFGFNGSFKYVLSFESEGDFVELPNLIEACFKISDTNILGIVLLAESKGFWGMHLKNAPIIEQKPKNNKGIFAPENFSEWMNFPVEPTDFNNVIAGAGVIIRDKSEEKPEIQDIFSKDNNYHLHAGIFEKEPLSKKIEHFDSEIKRVLTELEAYKIQHILGQSKFGSGLVGIIELDIFRL